MGKKIINSSNYILDTGCAKSKSKTTSDHCDCETVRTRIKKGTRFDKLEAIESIGKKSNDKTVWKFRCDCGNFVELTSQYAKKKGHCGCGNIYSLLKKGIRFDKLEAVEGTGKITNGQAVWKFRCDCGNFVELTSQHAKQKGHCGCENIYRLLKKGTRFDKLEAIEDTGKRLYGQAVWKFRCDCGNFAELTSQYAKKKGHCGCENIHSLLKKGTRLDKLEAIEDTGKRLNGQTVWKFRCDCGNFAEITSHYAKQKGHCGCENIHSLLKKGTRLDKLEAIEDTGKRSNGQAVWKFRCDCGNFVELTSQYAKKKGHCGCENTYTLLKKGIRFDKLEAIEDTGKRSNGRVVWKFRCDCENFVELTSQYAKQKGHCGCEKIRKQPKKEVDMVR